MVQADDEQQGAFEFSVNPVDSHDLTVIFEPGAGEFVLQAGQSLHVKVIGTEEDNIEITQGPGYVQIWPSSKNVVTVRNHQGEILTLVGYRSQ